jgi:hypothetical protein
VEAERIFDRGPRTLQSPARHGEGLFDFLNRSASTVFAGVRDLLEDWYSHVPAEHRRSLRGELTSREDRQVEAAVWELFLHEAFTRSGAAVTVHPQVPASPRHPDFLIDFGEHGAFYLEAVRIGEPPLKRAAQRRLDAVIDMLCAMPVTKFGLALGWSSIGPDTANTKSLQRHLRTWIDGTEQAVVAEAHRVGGLVGAVRTTWNDHGWSLTFRARPVRAPAPRGLVGIYGPEIPSVKNDATTLLRALSSKAGRYGQPDRPLVIAALANGASPLATYAASEALYGRSRHLPLDVGAHAGDVLLDGHWMTRQGWRRPHAPGVLLATNFYPWTVTRSPVQSWSTLQPGISSPWQPEWISRIDLSTPEPGTIPGSSISDLLGLEQDVFNEPPASRR